MNSAVLLFVTCVASATIFVNAYDSFEDNLEQWTAQCISETGANYEIIEAERNGADINDERVKCFHACMAIKMGVMSYDGTVDKEKIINFIPHYVSDEQRMEIMRQRASCVNMVGPNPCGTADLIFRCIRPATARYTSPQEHGKNVYYFFSVKRT
ncbi:uncharacterized protein [Chelonus insularis]|uniref:uncharacterized protein n=1 Tax=Chelonus insularis TaxID=460826 RepID=UPI00158E2B19|nr:uncharacterized protein LOC118066874 [Chelonus insularis]